HLILSVGISPCAGDDILSHLRMKFAPHESDHGFSEWVKGCCLNPRRAQSNTGPQFTRFLAVRCARASSGHVSAPKKRDELPQPRMKWIVDLGFCRLFAGSMRCD